MIQITARAATTSIQLEIWVPAIDVFPLNHSMAFLPERPPHSGRPPYPYDITDFPLRGETLAEIAKSHRAVDLSMISV